MSLAIYNRTIALKVADEVHWPVGWLARLLQAIHGTSMDRLLRPVPLSDGPDRIPEEPIQSRLRVTQLSERVRLHGVLNGFLVEGEPAAGRLVYHPEEREVRETAVLLSTADLRGVNSTPDPLGVQV